MAESAVGLVKRAAVEAVQAKKPLELRFGSVSGVFRQAEFGQPMVLLDAHIDQIGLVVTGHQERGFLKVAPYGGMDRRIMAAQGVLLYSEAEKAWLPGVVARVR